jgi:ankyrin repeat protein
MAPLLHAAKAGSDRVFKFLLEHSASHEIKNHKGWTPLHYTTDKNHLSAAVELRQADIDLDAVNHAGQTALDLARSKGVYTVTKYLASPSANPRDSTSWAKRNGIICDRSSTLPATSEALLWTTTDTLKSRSVSQFTR